MRRPKRNVVFRFTNCLLPHTDPTAWCVSDATFGIALVSWVRSTRRECRVRGGKETDALKRRAWKQPVSVITLGGVLDRSNGQCLLWLLHLFLHREFFIMSQALSCVFPPLELGIYTSVTSACNELSLAKFSHLIIFFCHSTKQVSAFSHHKGWMLILITLEAKAN